VLCIFAALLASALVLRGGAVQGFGSYPAGGTGRSISSPQCGGPLPSGPGAFAIIGVTGGRAFYQNPCLVSEYHWAQSAPIPPTLVMNLNAAAGSAAFEADNGPRGACRADDRLCRAYNFGYNAANLALADAQSQGATAASWWLDVETENTWADDPAENAQVIQAAIDRLRAAGVTVGLYSAPNQWTQIAGGFSPGLPVWVAGAPDAATAPSYCTAAHAFGGGPVWLVQYPTSDSDAVYACGAATPAPAPTSRPPGTPANVQATVSGPGTVQVTWTPDAATQGVWVYDSVTGGLTGVAAPPYAVNGLPAGSFRCFTVIAYNGSGYSGWSSWACVTLPG
jgi:hypothetical protein